MHLPECHARTPSPAPDSECTCSAILLARLETHQAEIERLKQAVVGQPPAGAFRWQTETSRSVILIARLKEIALRGIYNPISESPRAAEEAIGVICRALLEVIEVLEGQHR